MWAKAVVILVFVMALLTAQPLYAVTETGDITVSGTIPTPPPATPPTIDQPKTGDTFERKNITVSGKCIAGLIVKIFSNDIFAGSTICLANNTYSLRIDLFIDRNDLIARQYDSLNQPSPNSGLVTVHYIPVEPTPDSTPGTLPRPTVAHFQLVIDYDYTVQGVFSGQAFRLPIKFRGGESPYVVTIDWGDGSSNRFNRANTSTFDTNYTYNKPGFYILTLHVSDSSGQEAYLQFVVLVHGEPEPVKTPYFFSNKVSIDIALIVVSIGALLIAIAFAMGRRTGKHKK